MVRWHQTCDWDQWQRTGERTHLGALVQLRIDGEQIALPDGFDRVGQLIDQALVEREAGNRVASKVWIDGVELDDGALELLPQRAIDGVGNVEVETRAVEDVASSALESAAEYAPKIAARLREAADAYRAADERAAGLALAECIDALVVLFEALRGAGSFLSGGGCLLSLETAIAPALASLEQLQERGDWLGAADLIEFELADSLASWPAELTRFRVDLVE